jgi:hypothetical protein
MREAEAFAASQNRDLFVANVAPDAIPFYERLGYTLDANPTDNDPANPRMIRKAPLRPIAILP